jgi:hypothetical protein
VAIPLEQLLIQVVEQAIGYGVGGAITPAIEVAAQPISNRLWEADPSRPLDPATAALVAATGRSDPAWAAREAARNGTGPDAFAALRKAALQAPALGELLELLRRGEIQAGDVETALERLGIEPDWRRRLLVLRRIHLSPADAAMARQQGFIQVPEHHAIAALGGIEPADADLQYELSGLPYGIGEALELLRRDEIDDNRFRQVVREGHTKTKYTDDLLKLRYTPLSAAVAAELLIRERIGRDEALKIARENGMREKDFLDWSHGLGRPPGIMEALTLVNRGVMDKGGFHEVVARSDVRTEYVDQLFELRHRYPSLFQLRALIANGSITDDYAHDILKLQGYPAKLIDGIIHAAHGAKTTHHKTVSLSVIEQLYESGLESREWFTGELERLGYDEADRADLINVLEVKRLVGEVTHALAMLRSRYTGWKIGRDVVVAELIELLADDRARTRLIGLWDMEREANRPVLTKAEIGQALRVGRFAVDEAVQRWVDIGLSRDDAVTHAWIVLKRDPYAAAPA